MASASSIKTVTKCENQGWNKMLWLSSYICCPRAAAKAATELIEYLNSQRSTNNL